MGDFTKPMKWQRSFRKQLPEEVEAKDASSIPVRASNANESLVIEPKKRGRISKRNKNELEQQEGFDYITFDLFIKVSLFFQPLYLRNET